MKLPTQFLLLDVRNINISSSSTNKIIFYDRGSAHWFFDIVAGGLMGFAFDTNIGKNYRNYRRPQDYNIRMDSNSGYSIQLKFIQHIEIFI
jgi:hypothetical protein